MAERGWYTGDEEGVPKPVGLLCFSTTIIFFVQVYFSNIADKNEIFQGCCIDDFLRFP